jgi:hypothetical protein
MNMNHLIVVCLVFIVGIYSAFAEEDSMQSESVGGKTFSFKSSDKPMFESKIHDHLPIFQKLDKDSILFNIERNLSKQTNSNEKIRVRYNSHLQVMEYSGLLQYGIETISIDDYGMPKYIYFLPPHCRNFTKEEYDYNTRTHKIPPSFATITEAQAIDITKHLLKLIEGTESKKYDSVSVTPVGVGNAYIVTFRVKIKNDIWDSRSADIVINANTGEFKSFSGDGKREDVDYSYIPKIPKSQVLQMYEDEIKRLGADISISKIVLDIYEKHGLKRWAWTIYGYRKDKELNTAAMMFIDSETGEVFFKKMD